MDFDAKDYPRPPSMIHTIGGTGMDGSPGEIPLRMLGNTGVKVSAIGLGGYHIGKPDVPEDEAIRIIRTAIENGITFMDNSWDYNAGKSELRMGRALRGGYRDKAFLMTKIDGRDRWSAKAQLEESLARLETDRIDLLQFHEIIHENDPERIFAEGGAMEMALEAKDDGRIDRIGFTGHKSPEIHLKMLDAAAEHGLRFDAVQMPLNVMDAHFLSFEKKVLPALVREGIGVLGMKSMGDRILLESGTVEPIECLHYAMSLPTSVVITGCDSMKILEQALIAARTFRPMTGAERQAILGRTKNAAAQGNYEQYKTTRNFDSTYHNPLWLGKE
jgi:aryl-alcohol dehydrogenase-like predicted oxidoreductase